MWPCARRSIAFEPLPILRAIELINAAGGKAVVAHIPTLGSDWVAKFGPKYDPCARVAARDVCAHVHGQYVCLYLRACASNPSAAI